MATAGVSSHRRLRTTRIAAVVAVLTLLATACSSSGSDSAKSPASSAPPTSAEVASLMSTAETAIPDAEFRKMCLTVKGADALRVVVPGCSYLAAIVSHDGSKILAAPKVWRLENGDNTATSANELKESMGNHWFRDYVQDMRDIRWYVAGDDEAIAYYVLDIKSVPTIKSVLLTERFKIADGELTEIEAIFQYCASSVTDFLTPDGANQCTKVAQL